MKYSFKSRPSLAFLLVIFFNTFVDLGHKILLQDTLSRTSNSHDYLIYSSILNAFILLPYIFLFTPSGFISDKFSKPKVMFWTALAAVPILILVTICYYLGLFWPAYFLTLLLGVQSAINSPAKYGHIKEIYSKSDIARANAITQTIVMVAILLSAGIFTLLFSHFIPANVTLTKGEILTMFAPLGFILIILSSLETISTLLLAKRGSADPEGKYIVKDYFRLNYLKRYWGHIYSNKTIFICIIGLSVYWAANQVILVSYSSYLKEHLNNASINFTQGSIVFAGFGILLGALYAGRISRGYIETGIVPIASIAITICLFLFVHVLSKPGIIILELVYGFFGGMFIVPLNSLIQYHAKKQNLGKVLAGNNFCQNVGMFTFLIGNTCAALLSFDSAHILYAIFFLFLVVSVISICMLPQFLMRYVVATVMSFFYKLDVIGMNNIPEEGGVMIIGNHTSYVDWAILQMACPRQIRFVMERSIYEKWYLKWLLSSLKMIPVSQKSSKESIVAMGKALNNGDVVCIFPEGRLCRNGQIAKFYSGFSRAVINTSAVIIPFYMRGLWGSKVSRATPLYKKITRSRLRDTSIVFGKPMPADTNSEAAKQAVTMLSTQAWSNYVERHNNIMELIYLRANKSSPNIAVIDSMSPRLTYNTLIATVYYLKQQWKKKIFGQDNIGIILPSSAAGIIANMSVLAMSKTVVNLNFTNGKKNMLYACEAAELKTIITSRRFITKLSAKKINLEELLSKFEIIYMEDCITSGGKARIAKNKIFFKIIPGFIGKYIVCDRTVPGQTAAIMFSSGSEGVPKGVELTHSNIVANMKQVATVCNIAKSDVALSILPLFHSFGFTISTFMPLLLGCPVICYPDPTDAQAIGRLICKYRVSIIYATPTFFNLYLRNKKCLPEMFSSLRVIVAGAEKLSMKIKTEFQLKFNKLIYEGYGTTEMSPVVACNLPNEIHARDMHVEEYNREDTVGLPLPGSAFRVVDPETMQELESGVDGLVLASGPQLMKGYLHDPEKTKSVIHMDGDTRWYKTGDKGHLDKDGFLTLVDRYSRFAKVGGEMVSLGAVEKIVESSLAIEGLEVMAVAVADDRKGEVIYLLHNSNMSAEEIKGKLIDSKMNNLMLPKGFYHLDELPKLGSGKSDYATAKKIVSDFLRT